MTDRQFIKAVNDYYGNKYEKFTSVEQMISMVFSGRELQELVEVAIRNNKRRR